MENETSSAEKCCCHGFHGKKFRPHRAGGCVYGLAFLGALVYYIQNAHTFTQGLLGFLKALVWPAMIIYKLLEFLKM